MTLSKVGFIVGLIVIGMSAVEAAGLPNPRPQQNQSACWDDAARKYGVPIALLRAVAEVESSNRARVVARNTNGSLDYGFMQINDWWLPKLRNFGIGVKELMNPCTSLHVGAWILAHNINMYGYNWTAIGAYGAGTSSQKNTARTVYANKVLRAIDRQAKRKNKYGAKESSSPVITSSNVASNRMRGKSAKPAHQEQPLNLSNKGTSTGHSVVVSGGESSGNGNDARQASQIRWSIYD